MSLLAATGSFGWAAPSDPVPATGSLGAGQGAEVPPDRYRASAPLPIRTARANSDKSPGVRGNKALDGGEVVAGGLFATS
jgi:hypothetical protein